MTTSEQPKLGNLTTDIVTSLTRGTTGMVAYSGRSCFIRYNLLSSRDLGE